MDFVQAHNNQVVVEDGCQLIVAQAVTQEALGCSIKLRPRLGRESNGGIVIDPAEGKLADAPMQIEAT
jgi:hypothetical protein